MLCDKCGVRPATIKTITNINGVVTQSNLCRECAGANFLIKQKSSLAEMLSAVSGHSQARQASQLSCPNCGTTSAELRDTLYVGCENCYHHFASLAMPMINSVQNSTTHTGKLPNADNSKVVEGYAAIEAELKKAVFEERYEDAIILREKLRKLNGEL